MIKQILLQLVLILINAFFAATEIAVISLNEKKIKAKAADGDKKAIKMLKMIAAPTRFLSTNTNRHHSCRFFGFCICCR